jgi:hypothetical protein
MGNRKDTLQNNRLTYTKLMRGAEAETRTADVGGKTRKDLILRSGIQNVFD